jgi:hypothetical protein
VLRFRRPGDNDDQRYNGLAGWTAACPTRVASCRGGYGTEAREPRDDRLVSQCFALPDPIEGDTSADLDDGARKLEDKMKRCGAKRPRLLDRLIGDPSMLGPAITRAALAACQGDNT